VGRPGEARAWESAFAARNLDIAGQTGMMNATRERDDEDRVEPTAIDRVALHDQDRTAPARFGARWRPDRPRRCRPDLSHRARTRRHQPQQILSQIGVIGESVLSGVCGIIMSGDLVVFQSLQGLVQLLGDKATTGLAEVACHAVETAKDIVGKSEGHFAGWQWVWIPC
jgi:hypothetical protein